MASSKVGSVPPTCTSAWPDRLLMAVENSLNAAALIRWMAKPSATPTAMAATAVMARTGWARHSPSSSQRDRRRSERERELGVGSCTTEFKRDTPRPAVRPRATPSAARRPPLAAHAGGAVQACILALLQRFALVAFPFQPGGFSLHALQVLRRIGAWRRRRRRDQHGLGAPFAGRLAVRDLAAHGALVDLRVGGKGGQHRQRGSQGQGAGGAVHRIFPGFIRFKGSSAALMVRIRFSSTGSL